MSFVHPAFFYHGTDDYAATLCGFLTAGLAAGEPALVAVPRGRIDLVRSELGPAGGDVDFVDMEGLGRNPSRIIPAVRRFLDDRLVSAPRVRFVGEPIWAGRSQAEILEATRHEALVNRAFAHMPVTILCPYDATRLPATVLADAYRTHPDILASDGLVRSDEYVDPAVLLAEDGAASPPAPPDAAIFRVTQSTLGDLRAFVADRARMANVAGDRVAELVLAVTEATNNALEHGGASATVSLWSEAGSFICQVVGPGQIDDPLAGRHVPAPEADRGRGLWLINQLCDLVELRSGHWGTSLRLHVR